jgi:MYXO-CTERM domain-containing protein
MAFGSMLVLSSTVVFADVANPAQRETQLTTTAAQVLQVASGATRGRLDGEIRLRYPGFEQTTVVHSRGHIVLVTMEAVREPGMAPVQGACSSYKLRADGPPVLVADLKRLSSYTRGERAFNHPKAAADENGNIVVMYGSDSLNTEQNRPDTYAGIINENCDWVDPPKMVSIRRDANDGAPDISYLGGGNFVAGYYSDGGTPTTGFPAPGGDYSVAMGLRVVPGALLPTVERTWITPVVTPTNIGRPTLTAVAADRGLFCAPKGPNRPSDHIECALLDTNVGTVLWKSEVAMGDRQKKIYYNQPTVAKISDNRYALLAIESNGMGKQQNNVKGSNLTHMFMLERNGDSISTAGEIVGAAAHQTHASICAGGYGEAGTPSLAVFSAAPTGIGRAAMMMVSYEETTKAFKYDPKADLWPAAWYGDSGHLANWYGRNPMRQGRDFMRCIGDVANPGYHVPNGYMADVKTFFVGAVHGRVPGDAKNSLFLSLVPGTMDKKALPQNPVPAGEAPAIDPSSTPKDPGPAADEGGCGCTTPGRSTTNNGLALLGLVAFGAFVSYRRRRG